MVLHSVRVPHRHVNSGPSTVVACWARCVRGTGTRGAARDGGTRRTELEGATRPRAADPPRALPPSSAAARGLASEAGRGARRSRIGIPSSHRRDGE
eukprot:7384135-Prymnesium_polylepis.3